MSKIPEELLYTKEHEWMRVEGEVGTVGITDYAQETLGDVTYVELPGDDVALTQDDEAGAVESCKAAASVYAPASGTVVEINTALDEEPGRINADCYGEGWLYKLELSDTDELEDLLTPQQYAELIKPESKKS
ncbi:glycine cleavage system protein GcvH [Planctomycetota bacterium]